VSDSSSAEPGRGPALTHAAFVAACAERRARIECEPRAAARYVSARLWLPLVALPVLGAGVALVLVGWIYTGLAVIAAGIIVPRLIRRAAAHIVYQQALQDPAVYEEVTRAGVMRVVLLRTED
jgi:hypothetical protein